jgi:hypothetical protein
MLQAQLDRKTSDRLLGMNELLSFCSKPGARELQFYIRTKEEPILYYPATNDEYVCGCTYNVKYIRQGRWDIVYYGYKRAEEKKNDAHKLLHYEYVLI